MRQVRIASGTAESDFRREGVDVLLSATAPDHHGRFSFGPSAGHSAPAFRTALRAALELNGELPYTFGADSIGREDVLFTISASESAARYSGTQVTPIVDRIAEHVVELLPRGGWLQLGIGAVPEAVAIKLAEGPARYRFVGMASRALLPLLELHGGPVLISPEVVDAPAWAYCHQNRLALVVGADLAYNALRLAELGRLVAVNSALAVDRNGSIALERVQERILGGVGGALQFAMAAKRSAGGFTIFALPSVAGTGALRIVDELPQEAISIPNQLVDYIVTEFGVARLNGLSTEAKRVAIAEIAPRSTPSRDYGASVDHRHIP